MPTTDEHTIAHAILQIADQQPNGIASYDLIREKLPDIVSLTQDDLAISETRPNESMWHQIMRNIQSHHDQPENYIYEGYLKHVSKTGYRITPKGKNLLKKT